MTTSALLKHGLSYIQVLLDQLETWLDARDLDSPDRIRGRMSQSTICDPTSYQRANYIKTLQSYSV
jgi:dihydroorotate dehydrogenase (fumarate)